ncbi:glyoxylase-like metal-dependent hydrolase (beta-lactamase superfamily II) [Paenibacillus phyllosphaerae]|uniref:Glyoxylase-like metal-dependent hydrolase (Beta-lactamase superfamily II) n=1 Tax=Paenibacillus phyllosphaerae TaxID=274593 RepID=A0A7W5B1G9_9BACL|nr:MBL fold metallo-hydrolase [Paenibacillus phyllosphaerae]MBB3112517.1 glyoxylase-like metal-dependent hydrolase (beta-lactamase superfamily II) [Paenibacillus phyllosphaerae]
MNEVKIVRIPILPMHMVNAHLLIGPDGCVLVDAGVPGSERKIGRALAKEKMTFKDVKLIVITHAHVDHAGSAARLRELTGAPILAHEGDAKHYSREEEMTFCPTGRFARLFYKTGFILKPYEGFTPDVLVSGERAIDLQRFGVPGTITHTPGHTLGSISIALESKEALVGDLVASGVLIGGIMRKNHAIRPPFEDDPHRVAEELLRLLSSGHRTFHLGHGAPLGINEVRRHAEYLKGLAADM